MAPMMTTGAGVYRVIGGGGGNAFTLIANTSVASAAAPGTTSAIDTTGANLLVVAVSYYGGGSPPTLSDSKTNTWTGLTLKQTGNAGSRIFYCAPTSVGSGHTFTVNNSNAFAFGVQAWSGANASPFDVENGATASGVTSIQSGSVTPTNSNSLIVAAGSPTDNTSAYSVNSGFTATATVPFSSGTNEGLVMAYLKQNAASAVNPTFSWTTSSAAAATIAVFKP